MLNVSSMVMIPNFKIRTKQDSVKFVNVCIKNNNSYSFETVDGVCTIDKNTDGIMIRLRKGDQRDLLNASEVIARSKSGTLTKEVIDAIWKYRKYINRKWLAD